MITVIFDYDFSRTPACSAKVATNCVEQFVVYETSSSIDDAFVLGTVPLPANAQGLIHGISGTTSLNVFSSGLHRIAVTAQGPPPPVSQGPDAKPAESPRSACFTWVTTP